MHTLRSLPLVLFAAAACDGRARPVIATVGPDAVIDVENALAVAGTVYRAAMDPVEAAAAAARFLEVAPPEVSPGAPPPAVVVQEVTGAEGGTAVFTWEDRDRDGRYSSGDTFAVGFTDFVASGRVLAGTAAFDEVAIEGDPIDGFAWRTTARLSLLGVQVGEGEFTATIHGAFDCERERRATVRTLTLVPRQEVQSGPAALHAGAALARNDYVLDFSTGRFAAGSVRDPLLGTLWFATEAPLTGVQVLPYASAGAFVIDGARGASLTIQPLGPFDVEVLVDADGDGEAEAVLPAEWSALGR